MSITIKLTLPDDLYKQYKLACERQGTTPYPQAVQLIEDYAQCHAPHPVRA